MCRAVALGVAGNVGGLPVDRVAVLLLVGTKTDISQGFFHCRGRLVSTFHRPSLNQLRNLSSKT